jgi:hypothetical protein
VTDEQTAWTAPAPEAPATESSPETGFSPPADPATSTSTVTADPTQPGSNEPADAKDPADGEPKTVPANPAPLLPPVGNISGLQGNTKADDTQPLQNHFVEITAGDHQGQHGVFTLVVERDDDGFPSKVLVKIRDLAYDHEYVVVGYSEIVATTYNGGR